MERQEYFVSVPPDQPASWVNELGIAITARLTFIGGGTVEFTVLPGASFRATGVAELLIKRPPKDDAEVAFRHDLDGT